MDHASASFTSPWAVLSGHAITSTNAEHSFGHHHGLPMDLQYPYYRCAIKIKEKKKEREINKSRDLRRHAHSARWWWWHSAKKKWRRRQKIEFIEAKNWSFLPFIQFNTAMLFLLLLYFISFCFHNQVSDNIAENAKRQSIFSPFSMTYISRAGRKIMW